MTTYTRSWLRSFLRLGARMRHDGVPVADVERQEDTVLQALRTLQGQPGLVLADEVGMGKTFEALGVIAALRHTNPDSRVCIVTPGPDLNRKWKNELAHFSDPDATIYDFGEHAGTATNLPDLVDLYEHKQIAIVPVSAFGGARGRFDQAYLLSMFARWKGLHGATTSALFRRYRGGNLERVDVTNELFLGAIPLAKIEPFSEMAFTGSSEGEQGLAELFDEGGVDAFEYNDSVRRALDLARFRFVRALLPDLDLLVVDEAHKLKNPESLRHRGVATVFDKKYARALFLTATPFQLDISELRQVFSLFGRATTAPATMREDVERLFSSIESYQAQYDTLERLWRTLDAAQATLLAQHYARDPELATLPEENALIPVVQAIRAVRQLKDERIEPGFRRWMLRSIHQEKRAYRQHLPTAIEPQGESLLPFLVYERFIAELFRLGDSTHKAAVEVNMVSSFEAAANGSLFGAERDMAASAEQYRQLLREVLESTSIGGLRDHPKLDLVVQEAVEAAEHGEKTLIFCARTQTISRLAKEIDARWNARVLEAWRAVYPGVTEDGVFGHRGEHRERGYFERVRDRMHRAQDLLYIALRERYLQTLIPATSVVVGYEAAIAERATELLRTLRVGHTSATRIDYKLAKRCVERAAVERWVTLRHVPSQFVAVARAMTSDEFLRHGVDLVPDELEGDDASGAELPQWTITPEQVELMVNGRPHLWQTLASDLRRLEVDGGPDLVLRVRVVERLARYLTRRDVLFLPELLLQAKQDGQDIEELSSHSFLEYIDAFWSTPSGERWVARLREFLRYFLRRPRLQRLEIIDGPIATGSFVRNTVDADTREGLREAFNTPLNPMVLIANEVMQEGLDLHHNCRRIVHHDLAWNPAQLEQRVGRIDRLGSLVRRMRETHPDTTLNIRYPLVARTIDERMYRTVKTREKWLEFLLGARPSFNEFSMNEDPVPELPPGLAESLVIDLRPPRAPD